MRFQPTSIRNARTDEPVAKIVQYSEPASASRELRLGRLTHARRRRLSRRSGAAAKADNCSCRLKSGSCTLSELIAIPRVTAPYHE